VLTTAAAGLGGVAAAFGLAAASAVTDPAPLPSAAGGAPAVSGGHGTETVPFHGDHQAGITTPAQAHAQFLALDLRDGIDRGGVARLMRLLSDDAARLTQGHPALGDTEPEMAALPARLTVTFGFGARLFERIGLAARRPASVATLPAFKGDRLEPRWSAGDLLVQVCCDDPITLAHTVRMLVKDARSFATVRWTQRGFALARGSAPDGTTMRNLMGQVDGTVQPKPGPERDAAVWADGPPWFRGGSVVVVRRVLMNLENWDAFDAAGKEVVMGRRLADGSPLTGTVERDVPDLDAVDADGFRVIDDTAHIRLAKAVTPSELMLRRGYNFDEGPNSDGTSNAGLVFVAYQADAAAAFVPVQRRLAEKDALNKWITHVGSAVFALPPGAAEECCYVGESLLEV
jgi:dye decolorizing peroxidase